MTNTQFSSKYERWSEIRDFPGYSVSDQGRVMNNKFERLVSLTMNSTGVVMVGLMQDRYQKKRSLPLLVADAFVPRDPKKPAFDTVIHLDGRCDNNHYSNLKWRPLWFAREFKRQFTSNPQIFTSPVQDVETGEIFENSMHAAIMHGVLAIDVIRSAIENTYVWPTGQIFRDPV